MCVSFLFFETMDKNVKVSAVLGWKFGVSDNGLVWMKKGTRNGCRMKICFLNLVF